MGGCLSSSSSVTIPAGSRNSGDGEGHLPPSMGKTQPLRPAALWKSETPMTMKQLRSKRDEFWEISPSYDGRKEIWDALKAACEAEDLAMAQVIVDSAEISLPLGTLEEAFDTLGNRYVIPPYCISIPTNIVRDNQSGSGGSSSSISSSSSTNSSSSSSSSNGGSNVVILGAKMTVSFRFSSGTNKDLRMDVGSRDTVRAVKERLVRENRDVVDSIDNIKFFFGGKMLENSLTLAQAGVDDGIVVQVFVLKS